MNKIEFSKSAKTHYNDMEPTSDVERDRLICRMYNENTPEKGYIAMESCFSQVLTLLTEHKKLTHVDYNPFESFKDTVEDSVCEYGYNKTEKVFIKQQNINKCTLTDKESEIWLNLGKDNNIIPEDRNIKDLLKNGIKLPLHKSPTTTLGSLIHMRHMWRETGFIESVLFLISKTNMDFWQAYVLASLDKLETRGESITYINAHFDAEIDCDDRSEINILILPILRMVHENPEKFDVRSPLTCKYWATDGVFKRVTMFKIWIDLNALSTIDFKPLIYSNILEDKTNKKDLVNLVKEIVGDKYKLR